MVVPDRVEEVEPNQLCSSVGNSARPRVWKPSIERARMAWDALS